MKKLSEIALEIEKVKESIEKVEGFKKLLLEPQNKMALIEIKKGVHTSSYLRQSFHTEEIIHRFHNIETSVKNFTIKRVDKAIKECEDEILKLEREIQTGVIAEISESSTTSDKEKRKFFNKLYRGK